MQNRAALEHLAGCLLLLIGGALEVAGVNLPGLNLLIGLCFVGSMGLIVHATLQKAPLLWCALPFSLAAAALGFHIFLNCSG